MVAPNIRSVTSRQRGGHLLELSLVLFGAAVLIVGISDLARILHARGAVRAGVTEGLRCLYPTDAGCVNAGAPVGSIDPPRFTAWVWGQGYRLPRSDFRAWANWFEEPVLEAKFEATRLSRVEVERYRDPYRQFSVLFPVTAHSPYVFKARDLPRVALGAGPSPGLRVRNARFLDRFTGAERAPDQTVPLRQRILGAGEVGEGQPVLVQRVAFSMRDAWSLKNSDVPQIAATEGRYPVKIPCFQGPRASSGGITWPSSGGYPERCSYQTGSDNLYANRDVLVPFMFQVTGRGYVTSAAIEGNVTLLLEYSTRPGYRLQLGGQAIRDVSRRGRQEWRDVNFVPRGVRVPTSAGDLRGEPSSRFDADSSYLQACRQAQYSECEDSRYMSLPLIPLDAEVTLSVFVEWNRRAAGDVRNEAVAWDGAQLKLFYPSFQLARETADCGYSTQPSHCSQPPGAFRMLYHDVDLSRPLSHTPPGMLSCDRNMPAGTFSSANAALTHFRAVFLAQQQQNRPLSAQSFKLLSADPSDVAQCPAIPNVHPCNDDFKEHLKGCVSEFSIPDMTAKCNLSDFRPSRDRIRPVPVTEPRDRREERGQCSNELFPECSRPHLSPKGRQFLGLASGNCDAAVHVVNPTEKFGPLFNYRAEPGCPNIEKSIKEWYREKHPMPIQVPVVLERTEGQPALALQPPADACQDYSQVDDGNTQRLACAENVRRHVAAACCAKNPDRCELQELPGSGGSSGGGGVDIFLDAARERVEDTVMVAYPPAQSSTSCDPATPNCLEVTAGIDPDVTEARIRASMQVPLSLMSWLGRGDRATIAYEESRLLESALSGGAL